MLLLSDVRMGINLNLIDDLEISTVNELFIHTQPAHLQKLQGRPLEVDDRNIARASLPAQPAGRRPARLGIVVYARRCRVRAAVLCTPSRRRLSTERPRPFMLDGLDLDPHDVLGLARGCSAEDLREAYHKKSKKHHPDGGGDDWAFRVVVRAYEAITQTIERERVAAQSREAPDTGRIRAGVQDKGIDPARLVHVEMVWMRYEVGDVMGLLAEKQSGEDRNLSGSLEITWPGEDLADAGREPAQRRQDPAGPERRLRRPPAPHADDRGPIADRGRQVLGDARLRQRQGRLRRLQALPRRPEGPRPGRQAVDPRRDDPPRGRGVNEPIIARRRWNATCRSRMGPSRARGSRRRRAKRSPESLP